jgi:heme/copper-type cytochrome/quinol oxidase subunit 4
MEAGKWTAEDVRAALAEWQEASPVRISFSVDELSGLVLNLNLIEKHTRTIGVLRSRTAPAESAAIMDVADRLNSLMTTLVSAGQRVRQEREQEQNVKGLQRVLIGVLVVVLLALIPFMMSGSGAAAAPVLAAGVLFQEAEATVEPTSVTPDLTPVPTVEPVGPVVPGVVDTSEIPNYVMTFILVFVLALILLFGAVLVLLYRSVPAVFQSGINATLVSLFEKMQDLVAATPTKIDDALAEEIERRVWLRINEASKPTLAMEIGEARAKILSQAAPAPLSDGPADQ